MTFRNSKKDGCVVRTRKPLFANKTNYGVLVFIIALVLGLAYCEKSEAQTSMYISPVNAVGGEIKSDSGQLSLGEQYKRFEVNLNLTRHDGFMYGGFGVRRMVGDGPFKLGIGGTYWMNESPGSNSDFTFSLGIRFEINERWSIDYLHGQYSKRQFSQSGSRPDRHSISLLTVWP